MHLKKSSSRTIKNTIMHRRLFKRTKEVDKRGGIVRQAFIFIHLQYSLILYYIFGTAEFQDNKVLLLLLRKHFIATAGAVLEGWIFMARLLFPWVKHSFIQSSHGDHTVLHDSRGQTLCHIDKTTRSLITMLVWRSVKGKLQRLPLSTDLPHWPSCSGNSISARRSQGFCGVDWQRLWELMCADTISLSNLL